MSNTQHTGIRLTLPRSLSRFDRGLFGVLLLTVMILLTATGIFGRFDHVIYDYLLRLVPVEVSDDIAIVAIDEQSLAELGRWPWPREVHTELLRKLNDVQAKAVVFDILFTEANRLDVETDQALADAIRQQGMTVLPLHLDQRSSGTPLSEILPLPILARSAAQLGHAHIELDRDGIARGLFLHQGVGRAAWPALSLALLQLTEPSLAARYPTPPAGDYSLWSRVSNGFYLIPYAGPAGTIPTYSYSDLLSGKLPVELIKDRIIFIGATAAGMGDVLPTPYSGLAAPMPGVEVHANAYAALSGNSLIRVLPMPVQLWVSLILILLPFLLFPRITPELNLPLTLSLLLGTLLLSYVFLRFTHFWFPPVAVLTTVALAYPLWSWRRLSRLNAFLERKLQNLSREPAPVSMDEQISAEEWFMSLIRLLEPDESVLYYNGSLHRGSTSLKPPPDSLPDRRWISDGQQRWINFHQDGDNLWLAGLSWNQIQDQRAPTADQLQFSVMPPMQHGSTRHRLRPAEIIEQRIQLVQQGIRSLRTLRRFISDSFDSMPDGILVADALGQVRFANARCLAWLPLPTGQTLPCPLIEWFRNYPPQGSSSWPALMRSVIIDGQPVSTALRLGDRELMIHMQPFSTSDDHTGLIASLSDITHIREQQRQRLETIDFVSHDVRSPLVSQIALLDQFRRTPPDQHPELIERVRQYACKSLELADQYLQLTRVEAADEIVFYDCDLLAVLENAVDQTLEQAREKQIVIDIDDASDEAWMQGNGELLERVFVNLLTNSIKYSPSQTRVKALVRQCANEIYVEVRDQGYGIAPEMIDRIFERFRQMPDVSKQRITSAGLGLRFVKQVVNRHQGRIIVESNLNRGTCFRIWFPHHPSQPT